MNTNTLPTDELKKFGIINEDLSFSKKLNADDIQKFLQGYTIVADNDKNRATFQLTENNSKLKVIFLERDKNLSEILEKSKEKIQYFTYFGPYKSYICVSVFKDDMYNVLYGLIRIVLLVIVISALLIYLVLNRFLSPIVKEIKIMAHKL